MFTNEFVKELARAVAAELVDQGKVAPRLLSLEQAASYLGMTEDALRSKALRNQVPSVRIDTKYRFDKEELDVWIRQHKVA